MESLYSSKLKYNIPLLLALPFDKSFNLLLPQDYNYIVLDCKDLSKYVLKNVSCIRLLNDISFHLTSKIDYYSLTRYSRSSVWKIENIYYNFSDIEINLCQKKISTFKSSEELIRHKHYLNGIVKHENLTRHINLTVLKFIIIYCDSIGYSKIYEDIILFKFPSASVHIFQASSLSEPDLLLLNNVIYIYDDW